MVYEQMFIVDSVVKRENFRKIQSLNHADKSSGEVSELAEGARLEIVCTLAGTEGSNPSLSAIKSIISSPYSQESHSTPHLI